MSIARRWVRSASLVGVAATSSSCSSFWKCGVSSIRNRTYSPTRPSTRAMRKGNRQPTSRRNCSDQTLVIAVTTRMPPSWPTITLNCCQLAIQPRLPSRAFSTISAAEPVHSPPAEKPCTRRSNVNAMGAATPTDAYVGSRPMPKVASDTMISASPSATLRPFRSPSWPKNRPPSGRTTKPTPNTAKFASVDATTLEDGKNSCESTGLNAA